MGYSVLITRNREFPFLLEPEPSGYAKITRHEWEAMLKGNAFDLESVNSVDRFYAGIPVADRHLDAPCRLRVANCTSPEFRLGYDEATGSIVVSNPTPVVIEKLLLLAKPLNAVVRGSEGEIYTSGTEFEIDPNLGDSDGDQVNRRDALAAYLAAGIFVACLFSGIIVSRYLSGTESIVAGLFGAGIGAAVGLTVVGIGLIVHVFERCTHGRKED